MKGISLKYTLFSPSLHGAMHSGIAFKVNDTRDAALEFV